jgi:hypothetical protein
VEQAGLVAALANTVLLAKATQTALHVLVLLVTLVPLAVVVVVAVVIMVVVEALLLVTVLLIVDPVVIALAYQAELLQLLTMAGNKVYLVSRVAEMALTESS